MAKTNLEKYDKTLHKIKIKELNNMDSFSDWLDLANEMIADSLKTGTRYKISDKIKELFEEHTSNDIPMVKLKKAIMFLKTYSDKFNCDEPIDDQIEILRCVTDIILLSDTINLDLDETDVGSFDDDEIKGLKNQCYDTDILYSQLKYNLDYMINKMLHAIDDFDLSTIKLILDVGFLFLISEIDEYTYAIKP
mgnify:FL=1